MLAHTIPTNELKLFRPSRYIAACIDITLSFQLHLGWCKFSYPQRLSPYSPCLNSAVPFKAVLNSVRRRATASSPHWPTLIRMSVPLMQRPNESISNQRAAGQCLEKHSKFRNVYTATTCRSLTHFTTTRYSEQSAHVPSPCHVRREAVSCSEFWFPPTDKQAVKDTNSQLATLIPSIETFV